MREIYDRGYGRLFSNKVIFQQLIQSFVNEAWVGDLDFDTCERLQKSFIDKDYKKTESDVIYKVQVRGKDSYICILMLPPWSCSTSRSCWVILL
ncbi:MAG: Rpn family recombination-promoting nuclease/putative transposase [bacterium]